MQRHFRSHFLRCTSGFSQVHLSANCSAGPTTSAATRKHISQVAARRLHPDTWNYTTTKRYFSSSGEVPVIADPRVTFFKGWFEDTLPQYSVPPHERLFINMDADLYSSTKTVLKFLKDHIAYGTLIYFDEFSDRFHEMKAFDEFLREAGMRFKVIGADRQLSSVIFERVG